MLGETVKVPNIDILTIMYPDFKILSYVTFLNKEDKVIYVGKSFNNLEVYLKRNTKEYINTVGVPTIDLSTNDALLEYIYEKKKRALGNGVKNFLLSLDDKDFYYAIKTFWITGKLPYKVTKGVSMYHLFETFTEPLPQTLKSFFALEEVYPMSVMESSLMTFLQRVVNKDWDNVSKGYGKVLQMTYNRSHKNIKPALISYTQSDKTSLDLLNLILRIRG